MRHSSAFILCLLCSFACTLERAPERPPNIVLIIGDDHGYRDFGFMGSEIVETPNLDRLATGGVVFPLGYSTASVCRPSLRSLLTGLHPLEFERFEQQRIRQGTKAVPKTPLRDIFQTLPTLLAERGYVSFQSGKFQEGNFENAGFTHGMTRTSGKVGRKQGIRIVRETMDPVFEFIDEYAEQPFFVWFAPQLPHLPHNPPKRFRRPYEGLDLPWFAPGYYASVSWLLAGTRRRHRLRLRTRRASGQDVAVRSRLPNPGDLQLARTNRTPTNERRADLDRRSLPDPARHRGCAGTLEPRRTGPAPHSRRGRGRNARGVDRNRIRVAQ
ncbi:MAG: sulfatase-like hydrolase/transferase [Deltaproteobacteria bacterium]|nr:sulfatase-like hydrolase/transferase [Deltaproteobacteria bacterium]